MEIVREFLRCKCGAAAVDDAIVEYATATLNEDGLSDLDELLCGLSPDMWARQHSVDRETSLRRLMWKVKGTATDGNIPSLDLELVQSNSLSMNHLPPIVDDQSVQLAAIAGGMPLLGRIPSAIPSFPAINGSHKLPQLAYPTSLATYDEAMHSLVAAFLQRHQGELCDPAVATYVHRLLDCSTASEAIEMEELDDVLCGVSPAFADESRSGREQELNALLAQLHALYEERNRSAAAASPISPTKSSGVLELRGRSTSALSAEPAVSNEAVGQVGFYQPPPDPAALESLTALCPPGVGMEFLCHVLHARCLGDLEAAGRWIVDCGDPLRKEVEWREAENAAAAAKEQHLQDEKAEKKRLFAKYQLQTVTGPSASDRKKKPPALAAWQPPQGSAKPKGVRYRDGVPVASKGEKFIIEQLGEDWDGGSRGKVSSKGKRGPGMQ